MECNHEPLVVKYDKQTLSSNDTVNVKNVFTKPHLKKRSQISLSKERIILVKKVRYEARSYVIQSKSGRGLNEIVDELLRHSGKAQDVSDLIKCGVDLTKANKNGYLPLHSAAEEGRVDSIDQILKAGAQKDACIVSGRKKGMTALYLATLKNHIKAVVLLLEVGANVQVKEKGSCRTLLHIAVQGGQIELIELFLKFRVDKEAVDRDGMTPLHLAAFKGNRIAVDMLLKAGITLNRVDAYGYTALHWASLQGHLLVIIRLLKASVALEKKDKNGKTPLYKAVDHGQVAVAALLLKAGAKTDILDEGERTPLHKASSNGHETIVDTLLQARARISCADMYGRTPLHLACQNGHLAVVSMLLNAGTARDVVDVYGSTPLKLALKKGYRTIIEMLVSARAEDENDYTLFELIPYTCATPQGC